MASIEEQERDWEIAVNQAAPLRVRQEIQEVSW
jgi:hypothetical protein